MIKVYRKMGAIKAEQFDGSDNMINKYHIEFDEAYVLPFRIETIQGWLGLPVGDWIETRANGRYRLISDDLFKKTYTELPVIPNYVAKYINDMKSSGRDIWDDMHYLLRPNDISEYIEDNFETFARAWLDGYEVEEEDE